MTILMAVMLSAALRVAPAHGGRFAVAQAHRWPVISACDKAVADESFRLVTLQCPPSMSAAVLSDALMEQGAMYVSVSDGAAGTADEQPIFSAVSPDGVEALESWDELLEAKKLWHNSTLEVAFPPSYDVGRALLAVIADARLTSPGEYRIALAYNGDLAVSALGHVWSGWR